MLTFDSFKNWAIRWLVLAIPNFVRPNFVRITYELQLIVKSVGEITVHHEHDFSFLPHAAMQMRRMLSRGVCQSICHVRGFCQNEYTYLQKFFTVV